MPEQTHGEVEAEPRLLVALRAAFLLSVVILGIEAVGAYLSRSLALTVDTAHNVPDLAAFAASWGVMRGLRGGRTASYTFGSHRLEVFAGLLNAALVLVVGVVFVVLAIDALRAATPFDGPVAPAWILAAAVPTLVLRAASLGTLRRIPGRARDLNVASVLVHLSSDLVITVALLGAGISLVLRPAAWWADPVAAVVIGGVLVWESVPLFRSGWDVLTERTPGGLALAAVEEAARSVPQVAEVHDVHVWAVCPTLVCMSAHVRVSEMSVRESMGVVAGLRRTMEERFGIVHSVFEVEVAEHP